MPIKRNKGESEKDFLSRCISTEINNGKESDQASAICYSQLSKENMSKESEEVFVLTPKKAENRGAYLSRCQSHQKMKAQYPNMKDRMGNCLNAFNSYYKYWSRLAEFGSEEHPDVKFEGCMSKHKASGKDYKEAYTMCMSDLLVEPVAMEEMGTAIGDCISKTMKEDSSLSHDEARKRCSASVVVQPSGGTNPNVAPQAMGDYPWDQCIQDQLDKGYDEESAKKICGSIKAENS